LRGAIDDGRSRVRDQTVRIPHEVELGHGGRQRRCAFDPLEVLVILACVLEPPLLGFELVETDKGDMESIGTAAEKGQASASVRASTRSPRSSAALTPAT